MVVQHNLTAMNSNRMLGLTTTAQAKSTEKLSSGYKINRAADDAAGLAISEKMRRQIRGLTQASANAQDGISAVQTAEGALTEVHDMLQRMNELATKSANGTNSQEERDYIQSEVDALIDEIDRVSETTKFNELYLLKGGDAAATDDTTSAAAVKKTVTMNSAAKALAEASLSIKTDAPGSVYGAGETEAVTADTPDGTKGKMDLNATEIANLGTNKLFGSTDGTDANYTEITSANLSDYYTVANDGTVSVKAGATIGTAGNLTLAQAGGCTAQTGTDATKFVTGSTETVSGTKGTLDKYVEVGEDGKTLKYKDGAMLYTAAADTGTDFGAQVETTQVDEGDLDQYFETSGNPILKGAGGDAYTDADVDDFFDEYGVYQGGLFLKAADGTETEIGADQIGDYFDFANADGSDDSAAAAGSVLEFKLHVGAEGGDLAEANCITVKIESMSAAGIGIDGLRSTEGTPHSGGVSTQDDAQAAIETIKSAIKKVSQQRSDLGAVQNRLEHTINNLDNVVENTTSAESQIRDTDMATEMVKYANNNILAQAGQAMLAQANQANQGVLSLLG